MAVPRVSIGLPVYNGEKYLPNTLTRLVEQDFEDFELIVSDNASTDRTPDICCAFAERDPRVRYFRNATNIGLAANHNRTIELSRGHFFKWVAHDDDFPKRMLARFVDAFEEGPRSLALVYSRCEYIDEFGNIDGVESDQVDSGDSSPHKRLAHFLWNVHMYNSIYGLIRMDVLRQTRLHGLYPMADHVLLSELAMLGVFLELAEPLLRIRRHPGRTFTANSSSKALRELFAPGQGHRFPPVSMKMHMGAELIRSTMLIPRRPRDKVLCTAVALAVPAWRNFRAVGGRYKGELYRMLASAPTPKSSGREARRP
jgi:glycosyltransferase involved in cell wall biosynthesis